ncbi:MAG: hypothetical protein Q8O03_00665 [Nanoarchaeota archaeon]|nr:hypothetical protein [Nanoarchaeota archaeon]
MDKEQATKLLAKELVKLNGQKFIVNQAHQKQTLEKALSCYPVEHEKPFSLQTYTKDVNRLTSDNLYSFNKGYKQTITAYCSKVEDANYVFTEHFENFSQTHSPHGGMYSHLIFTDTFSFFALIGEQEAEYLKKHVYKDVSPEVVTAMNTMGIKPFADAYKVYNSMDNFLEMIGAAKASKKFLEFATRVQYDNDEEVKTAHFTDLKGIDTLNKQFELLGVKARLSTTEDRKTSNEKHPDYVHKKNLSKVVEELRELPINTELDVQIPDNFFAFVFSLPYKDQNIEANKLILKQFPKSLDYKQILVKEYSEGSHFCEYFDALSKDLQEKVVESLKNCSNKKLSYDSFLWSKDFKSIKLDYMNFYKENTGIFIEYFSKRNPEEKKVIIKDVMDTDFVNEEVVEWLNQNESELIREVGLNG